MKYKELIHTIKPYLIGLLIGMLVSYVLVVKYYDQSHVKLYSTNIGGFVFYHNKIYSLSELKNI